MFRSRPGRVPPPVCLLLVIAFIALAACDDKKCPPDSPCPTPSPLPGAQCANVAGTRNMFWSDSCGRSGAGTIVIAQAGCSVNASTASLGSFSGTMTGTSLSFTLMFSDPCAGSASGTASVNGSSVSGSYSGTQTGGSGCCSPVTGTFSFDYSSTRPPTTPTPTPAR